MRIALCRRLVMASKKRDFVDAQDNRNSSADEFGETVQAPIVTECETVEEFKAQRA